MSNRSLAGKIYISIIILMLIIIISSAYTITMINKTQEYAHETAFMWLPSVDAAQDMKYEIAQLRRRELRIATAAATKELEEYFKFIKERFDIINNIIKKYENLISSNEERNLFSEFIKDWNVYLKQREKFLSLVTSRRLQEANLFLLNTLDPNLQEAQTVLEKISEINYDGSIKSTQKGEFLTNITNITMAVIIGISIIILIGIFQIVRKSTKTIINSVDDLKEQSVSTSNVGESLKSSSTELSSSVSSQASSVHETSAAVNEISSMINRTSENAKETLNVVKNASGKTKEGEKIMERLAKAMETIQESSTQLQNIAGIINQINVKTAVINDIVSKTELLSLNASIESARAGEHGKGFAVVAEEVGNLAKVSGKAANEIQMLLQTSQSQVNAIIETTKSRVLEGKNVTIEAQEVFKKISENITTVTQVTEQISDATKEQEVGIRQISTSMSQIDKSIQNSQIIVHTTEESALQLVEQSKKLDITANNIEILLKGAKEVKKRNLKLKTKLSEIKSV
jgi:methyl-accepting chemotaxis protein